MTELAKFKVTSNYFRNKTFNVDFTNKNDEKVLNTITVMFNKKNKFEKIIIHEDNMQNNEIVYLVTSGVIKTVVEIEKGKISKQVLENIGLLIKKSFISVIENKSLMEEIRELMNEDNFTTKH